MTLQLDDNEAAMTLREPDYPKHVQALGGPVKAVVFGGDDREIAAC